MVVWWEVPRWSPNPLEELSITTNFKMTAANGCDKKDVAGSVTNTKQS